MKLKIKKHFKNIIKTLDYVTFMDDLNDNQYLFPFLYNWIKYKNITLYNILKKTKGLNSSLIYYMLSLNGISPNKRFKILNINKDIFKLIINKTLINLEIDITTIKKIIEEKKINIEKKINLKSHKGKRLKLNLPIRGQRTSSNSKTRKKYKIV